MSRISPKEIYSTVRLAIPNHMFGHLELIVTVLLLHQPHFVNIRIIPNHVFMLPKGYARDSINGVVYANGKRAARTSCVSGRTASSNGLSAPSTATATKEAKEKPW